jgi:hypothetical protein
MKTKLFISIAFIFLGFNSCKKIREKVFSTRMEGKVIDMQTGKGIPNARLVVYRNQSYQGGGGNINYFPLKTFYADVNGNFKDKIKIKTTEKDEIYTNFMIKAEPDGYEKTEGTDCYVSNCNENVPYVYLNLTKANKDIELKCNPEFELDLTLIDKEPFNIRTFKQLFAVSNVGGRSYLQPNGEGSVFQFNDYSFKINLVMTNGELKIILKGYDHFINPPITDTLLLTTFILKQNEQLTLEY